MATGGLEAYPLADERDFECAICMDCFSEPYEIIPCGHRSLML